MNRRIFLGSLLGGIASLLIPLPKPTPKSVVISRSTERIIQSDAIITVPTFEIVNNPSISLNEIKARRFHIVNHAQQKAKEAIQKEEDYNIFRELRRVA